MRILLAATISLSCEEEYFVSALQHALTTRGHVVESFMLPVISDLLSIAEQIVMTRLLDIGTEADMLITVGYPACFLSHPKKRVFLFSMMPCQETLIDTEYGVLVNGQYTRIMNTLHRANLRALSDAETVFCASRLLADKIAARYGVQAQTLYPRGLLPDGSADTLPDASYFVCQTTLEPWQRIELILDAFAATDNNVKLLISVLSSTLYLREDLVDIIERLSLTERVILIDSPLTVALIKSAVALICVPIHAERMEAAPLAAIEHSVPVITAEDSGCVMELISRRTGLIVPAVVPFISEALNKLLKKHKGRKNKSAHFTFSEMDVIAQRMVI